MNLKKCDAFRGLANEREFLCINDSEVKAPKNLS
jgi:hypothetical protein